MNTNRSFLSSRSIFYIIILIALPVLWGCSLTGSLGQSPTVAVPAIQTPQVTVMMIVVTSTPEPLVLPTETPQPTETTQPTDTESPTETVAAETPTETANPVPEFVEVKNIKAFGFNFSNSTKCMDAKVGCWMLTSYKQNASLEAQDYIFIDPAWANPFLVFWQKYESQGYSYFGFVEITGDTDIGWTQKKGFKDTNYSWEEEAIDLSEYKGSEILIRIMFNPTSDQFVAKQKTQFNPHTWSIAAIKVVPNYMP
jgi:hypothetical protein